MLNTESCQIPSMPSSACRSKQLTITAAFAMLERQFDRLGQTLFDPFANHDPIDDRLDRVVLARRESAS